MIRAGRLPEFFPFAEKQKKCDKEGRYGHTICMGKHKIKQVIIQYILIALAAVPYAVGLSLFLDPNDLAPGGITGISVLLNRLTSIETGTLIFLLNIPILLLGLWKFGWRLILSTLYALLWITFLTNCLKGYPALTDDRLLAALVGGFLVAFAMGVIFRCRGTTGGMDIIVKLLRRTHPHMKTGTLFFCLDFVVVLLAGIVFRNLESAIYAAIAVLSTTYTLDLVLYGKDEAKLIYIISDVPGVLAENLLYELKTGVTILRGEGAYSHRSKQILMLVTAKKRSLRVEEIVKKVDPRAFMIITDASEIYGEGYKNLFAEKL